MALEDQSLHHPGQLGPWIELTPSAYTCCGQAGGRAAGVYVLVVVGGVL